MANEVHNFNIGGVDHEVQDLVARQAVAAVQTALDALTSGDTTTAIKTFQEVIDFLDGVTDSETLIGKLNVLNTAINGKYTKPNGGIPASDLEGSIPAGKLSQDVQTSLGKADTAYQKPQTGIPATDLAEGVIPDPSNLATKTELAGKVDKETGKGLSSNDYTTTEKNKLAGIAAGAEVNVNADWNASSGDAQILNKPTLAPVATSGSYNDLSNKPTIPDTSSLATKSELQQGLAGKQDTLTFDNAPTANSNNVVKSGGVYTALQTLLSNITIGQNGNWFIGQTDTQVNAVGEKGDTGNVEIEDAGDMVALIVNDLTTGGAGNFLSAEMGKRLKQNVDAVQANIVKLYSKLANMAFWDAEDKAAAAPTALDWSVPKVTVTITNSIGSDAVIKHNGTAVSGSLQVDQGDPLTLTIEAANSFGISNVAATVDGVAATLTESGGVYTLAIAHVNANMAIVISGTSLGPIFLPRILTTIQNGYLYLTSGSSKNNRATLAMARDENHQYQWNPQAGVTDIDTQAQNNYTLIPIPAGATSVSMKCGSAYYYGLTLVNQSAQPQNTIEWTAGTTTKTLLMANYPNATHIACNFKIGSAGTQDFTGNETIESMGIELVIQ